jgi:hypothetical protein
MLVARAISLRPDIRNLRSIGVQRNLHWRRTRVCRSAGVLPATGADGHAACRMAWPPPISRVDRAH